MYKMSINNIQENCRLCQKMPGTLNVIQNPQFIDKVFEVTKIKINHDQMQLFPKAVCTPCQLSIEQMYTFIQQIRLVNEKLHSVICVPKPDILKTYNTRSKPNNKISTFKMKLQYSIHPKLSRRMTTAKINQQIRSKPVEENVDVHNGRSEIPTDNHIHSNSTMHNEDDTPKLIDAKIHGGKSQKNKNVFPCTYANCTKACTSSYTLKTHLMKHEGKTPFLCVTCGKGFRTKNSLNCHEKIHAVVKPYVCHECNIAFSVSSNLRAHQKKHHEGIRYYCSQCPLVYISKCSLERHELVHTGIKQYKCGSCKAAFYTNKELLKHERYHQGLRLYKCEQCFKTFFEKHHLTVHIRSHTGEKPYLCRISGCGKSFTESQKLTRHLKARHPDPLS